MYCFVSLNSPRKNMFHLLHRPVDSVFSSILLFHSLSNVCCWGFENSPPTWAVNIRACKSFIHFYWEMGYKRQSWQLVKIVSGFISLVQAQGNRMKALNIGISSCQPTWSEKLINQLPNAKTTECWLNLMRNQKKFYFFRKKQRAVRKY